MECDLDVNSLLPYEITKITNSLMPPGFVGDSRSIRMMQDSLTNVIDSLGKLSAETQGLSKVITSALKLRTADNCTLYIMKDPTANNGAGEAIGFLKMGRKHLFLYDETQTVREVEPICVLDFYMKSEYQRQGRGKALFDHMLQDMNVNAWQLAIDGPSDKMRAFMLKNYNISQLLRQGNNFAVSPNFFDGLILKKDNAGDSVASESRVTRYSAPKPNSSIGNVIHGNGGEKIMSTRLRNYPRNESSALCEGWTNERAAGEAVARPCTLPVRPRSSPDAPETPALDTAPALGTVAQAAGVPSRRGSDLTPQGFVDIKFHHKKIW